jgi:probable H4MPT-linked C1 transfer pathway protein
MTMPWLGLDVGGANLKLADGRGFAVARPFPLWRQPRELAAVLHELLRDAPAADGLAVTMTGELADCFETKREGVASILDAVSEAAGKIVVRVYVTSGAFVEPEVARCNHLLTAAANWHALARFAGSFVPRGAALLIDVGSTTTDIIPLVDGKPAPRGLTDPQRLMSGELVYTGVERSPVCAVIAAVPWRGQTCPVAQELFATTCDAYLILGDLPDEPASTHTADGRPATRAAARDRLARMICADREMFDEQDARAAARAIADGQLSQLASAARRVLGRLPHRPLAVVLSGSGEFLGRRLVHRLEREEVIDEVKLVSLQAEIGPLCSRCATAHALAALATEMCR